MTAALPILLALLGAFLALAQGCSPEDNRPHDPDAISAAWANDGGDKVTRDELRSSLAPDSVKNSVWDGKTIKLFGARNEVVSFNLVLEAATKPAYDVNVTLESLEGPGGASIESKTIDDKDQVFDWRGRDIELFYVRYLQIKGLSSLSYNTYDERHVPFKLRRPWTGQGQGQGTWTDRPNHDKFYPEIAAPLELHPNFTIESGQNQSIWADLYIPKTAPAGAYSGVVTVTVGESVAREIPVSLVVKNFALPDVPAAKSMVNIGYGTLGVRYTGVSFPNPGTIEDTTLKLVRDRHFQLAHRHKISLIDNNDGSSLNPGDRPRPEWISRLDGSLYTEARGYAGPGTGVGNDVYSIGTYGSWSWKNQGIAAMWTHTDAWEQWFSANFPGVERFLYLIDESSDFATTQLWASWMETNPGPGRALKSFATIALPEAVSNVPALDIAASWVAVADTGVWQAAADALHALPGKRVFLYNGKRPGSGSFATEDDGVALRELAWGQYKMKIDRWFFWESTYYNDTQGGRGNTNLFETAQTFGGPTTFDSVLGQTGWNSSNGDGVLFYPGTDRIFPNESYDLKGPLASLRLKHWRRGIQDIDYLTMAAAINPTRVREIVQELVPKAAWEVGVANPLDPSYQLTDISWPIDPDRWEAARAELASIIAR